MGSNLEQRLSEYIKAIPSLPVTVSKALEVCDNTQASPGDLSHVISLDPVLMGQVLKLINSAYYGLDQHVTSLVRAIIMLGLNTVKNLALSSAVLASLSAENQKLGLNMEGFWRHSFCVGVAAKLSARRRGIGEKQLEEYFAAGLLHDIGKIALNGVLAGDYLKIVSAADRERMALFQIEERLLGLDHCKAGALIVHAWNLSGAVGDTIVYHHNLAGYKGPCRDVLYSVAAANYFADSLEIGFSGSLHPLQPEGPVWQFLGLDSSFFDGIEPQVIREIEKAQVFLKM